MSGLNDFVIKFATVNGSGSASANTIFAKTLFRMGIPVSAKNIFPSNIQGLPTWYEVRVSEAGYLARRDGIDLMVAMNPQTFAEDVAEIVPGGWLLYDSTMPRIWPRSDITVIGIPIAEICARKWTDPRQRQLFKNMVYVGALSGLLDMDMEVLKGVIADQLKGKDRAAARDRAFRRPAADQGSARPGCQRQDHGDGQRSGRPRCHLRRGYGVRLVSDHPVHLARRSVRAPRQPPAEDQGRKAPVRDRAGRG
jgi:Pyruvate/2-oxoacid:ferredoxin oxidoreductase gamma subunit